MEGVREGRAGVARGRVLLAEDDAAMRSMIACALRAAGHEVLELGDGSEVLAHLAACAPGERLADLVILDVHMPRVTGLETLERLRRASATLRVILMTGFGDAAIHAEGRRLGAAVLDKPFDLALLEKAAREAVEAR